MLFALSHCGEWDLALTLKVSLDMEQEDFLDAFDRQENVGPVGVDAVFSSAVAPGKNACVAC